MFATFCPRLDPTPDAVLTPDPPAMVAATQTLKEFLDTAAPLVPPTLEGTAPVALKRLRALFRDWCAPCGFHMFLTGSYRLGIHAQDGDIDVVFVVPRGVSRAAVFSGFVGVLGTAPDVEDLQPIPDARVPIIGLKLRGQEFDVMTVHLEEDSVPDRDVLLTSYTWMNGIDRESILSFGGVRVTEMLIHTPQRPNQFLLAVRFLRLWAKRRGVYSNKAGFLGGVNICLMVLHLVRRAPRAGAGALVHAFFDVFANWRWDSTQVTALAKDSLCPPWLTALNWNPTIAKRERMVILTPCFPQSNSMFAATMYSRATLVKELKRGRALLRTPGSGSHDKLADSGTGLPSSSGPDWGRLTMPLDVLATCARFVRVRVKAPDTPLGRTWQGYVESQVRHLVEYLSHEELAVKEYRYIPEWATILEPGTIRVRETYITAEDDGRIRTFKVRGSLDLPLQYFQKTHTDRATAPPRPKGASIAAEFIPGAAVLDQVFHKLGTTRDAMAASHDGIEDALGQSDGANTQPHHDHDHDKHNRHGRNKRTRCTPPVTIFGGFPTPMPPPPQYPVKHLPRLKVVQTSPDCHPHDGVRATGMPPYFQVHVARGTIVIPEGALYIGPRWCTGRLGIDPDPCLPPNPGPDPGPAYTLALKARAKTLIPRVQAASCIACWCPAPCSHYLNIRTLYTDPIT
jgi:hypothetical protein